MEAVTKMSLETSAPANVKTAFLSHTHLIHKLNLC